MKHILFYRFLETYLIFLFIIHASLFITITAMLHLPDRIQSAEVSSTTQSPMDVVESGEATASTSRAVPPLQQRMQYHRTKGSLLRPPPSQKVDVERCTDIAQLHDIIHRFDRLSTKNLLPKETLAKKREQAQKRILDIEKMHEDNVHEGIEKMSLKNKSVEKPVDSKVYMSTHDSLNLQKEELQRQENQRMVNEVMHSSRKAQDEAYAQFWSDSDGSDDGEDDDNWLMPSFSRRKADEQEEQLDSFNNLDINDDELTNAHVDAAGSLLERGDT